MPRTPLNSNEDLLQDLMSYSPQGPLGQLFVMDAVRKSADAVASGPVPADYGPIRGESWQTVAVDIKQRCDAFYDRTDRMPQAPGVRLFDVLNDTRTQIDMDGYDVTEEMAQQEHAGRTHWHVNAYDGMAHGTFANCDITIDADGQFTASDTDGNEHNFTVLKRVPATAFDFVRR